MTNKSNGWQKWVIGALLGLLLGGVGSSLYGSAQLAAAEKRWKDEIQEVKAELKEQRLTEQERFDVVIDIATAVARTEERVVQIDRRLNSLVDRRN